MSLEYSGVHDLNTSEISLDMDDIEPEDNLCSKCKYTSNNEEWEVEKEKLQKKQTDLVG